MDHDIIVIGGGIVGLATAWQLKQRHPRQRILLLEKESEFATHQTGRNSGVIHAGVYYAPGSLKARLCREGAVATKTFCREEGIPFDECGKLLVATNAVEYQRMQALFKRCDENRIEAHWLEEDELAVREPHIYGVGAIWVPATGIVDFGQVARAMGERYRQAGGETVLQSEVTGLEENDSGVTVHTSQSTYRANYLVACGGLMADRLVGMQGLDVDFRIIPFRGEYYRLPQERSGLINHLIYPIPNPDLPFLGVHLTRMIDGGITVGPNAVLGWKREGYGGINLGLRDSLDVLGFSGFWHMARRHWRFGLEEWFNARFKAGYLQQVRKYCPQLELADLMPHPAGVRAQAVLADGTLVHDFLFAQSARSLHVCNAPSPAATSAIPIGGYICNKLGERM